MYYYYHFFLCPPIHTQTNTHIIIMTIISSLFILFYIQYVSCHILNVTLFFLCLSFFSHQQLDAAEGVMHDFSSAFTKWTVCF